MKPWVRQVDGRGWIADRNNGLLKLDGIAYRIKNEAYQSMAMYLINRRGFKDGRTHAEYVLLRNRLAEQLKRSDTRGR